MASGGCRLRGRRGRSNEASLFIPVARSEFQASPVAKNSNQLRFPEVLFDERGRGRYKSFNQWEGGTKSVEWFEGFRSFAVLRLHLRDLTTLRCERGKGPMGQINRRGSMVFSGIRILYYTQQILEED
ncbi:uncharacterized protein LOC111916465 [Lactuca sativa]|uniref:uncharacterized protein LOC111916465 n=1 Tax=Lactuca sativa TaxID=4236 RepID=UPI001C68A2D0|nr:uncharacterized protein LOC111916465 [Lactuca sativa]